MSTLRTLFVAISCSVATGCESTDIDNGDGTVEVTVEQCDTATSNLTAGDTGDPPGVVATCDDHLPCTVDIQCTPCSAVPESIRFIKATCTPDDELSPFCFDAETDALVYTGCTHIIADVTPAGASNACFPVANTSPGEPVYAGKCNAFGVCVPN